MNTSSPRQNEHRLTQLSLTGEGAWPDLHLDHLSPQLNVLYGAPRTGKSSVAQLLGHLLYGKSDSAWRRQFGQTVSSAPGSIQVDGTRGSFELRRQYDENRQLRLTIASGRGDAADSQFIENFLAGLSPQLASKVFYVDFAERPRAESLLNEDFAHHFTNSRPSHTSGRRHNHSCCGMETVSPTDQIDRRRVEELIQRRDTIAGEIEEQLARRRNESDVLEREIHDLDALLKEKRNLANRVKSDLRALDVEIADIETNLRLFTFDRESFDRIELPHLEQHERELATLDQEIQSSRQSIEDLKRKEHFVGAELAQLGPDGGSHAPSLAEGRITLARLEQLLDNLDAEVSQLARANEPGRCIGHDSHARISPVATLLRQQIYVLCGQLTEQERHERRQQLAAESRQLARVHTELSEHLHLLLSRRESLIQLLRQPRPSTKTNPVALDIEYCRCEHHSQFLQTPDAIATSSEPRLRESDLRDKLTELQRRRIRLLDEYNSLQQTVVDLEARWQRLQDERAGLISGRSIEDQQAELERLEQVLRQSLQGSGAFRAELRSTSATTGYWRASDILAQLTSGQLVQIRLERDRSLATIVDRHGHVRTLDSLSAGEHDQLYLALTLSLVGSYARRGIHLPLLLDEPFLQQDSAQTAAMAGVLQEFAQSGHQLFVFTEDREAKHRFSTLSARLIDLERHRQSGGAPVDLPRQVEPTRSYQTTSKHLVRETLDGHSTPALRLVDVEQDETYYLSENSQVGDFPVLGAETSTIFERIGIHTVGDLLASDPAETTRLLNMDGITVETISLWLTHMSLMCYVPNLTLNDAQVLSANGILSPEDLFDADPHALQQSIDRFLSSDQGRRFQSSRSRYGSSRLQGWQTSGRTHRDRWRRSSKRYSKWLSSRNRSRRRSWSKQAPQEKNSRRRRHSSTGAKPALSNSRKFYLSQRQDVEDAPSIGPKTAERLAKVGIRTVADLLSADPESTAAELDVSHINSTTLAAWQHQARLVCQIPELRGYGAQLLVGCGLTQPEQIAGMSTTELVKQILDFCETKEGQRILRSGEPPQEEKIAQWVELASLSRDLEAA